MEREARIRGYRALLDRAEGDAVAMASLARLMRGDGLNEDAVDLAGRALALAPGDGRVRSLASDTLAADVPGWHFRMLRDAARTAAYEAALRRAVTPETRVLEIGSGSGILAMMAARAGAKHVYTCEAVPAIARAARDIVALNGFADRITVVTGHSSALSPADLGGPVDVLVSEIISNDVVSEGVLPSLADAMERLVAPGAAVIPAAGSVRVALAHHARFGRSRLGIVDGFDLSPFNRLSRDVHLVDVEDPHLSLRGDPAVLFRFDFAGGGPWPPASAAVEVAAAGGPVNGLVRWIALELDATGRYENRPGTLPRSAWAALFHPFDGPGEGPASGVWRVHGRHEEASMRVWAAFAGRDET